MAVLQCSSSRSEGKDAKYHYMICGVQGDFTRGLVDDPPRTIWTRQLKFAGVSNTSTLYRWLRRSLLYLNEVLMRMGCIGEVSVYAPGRVLVRPCRRAFKVLIGRLHCFILAHSFWVFHLQVSYLDRVWSRKGAVLGRDISHVYSRALVLNHAGLWPHNFRINSSPYRTWTPLSVGF